MSFFNEYSDYYDLLYRDKPYDEEAGWVVQRIRSHLPDASTLLDLGCGTGRYTRLFREKGFSVCGVDASPSMIARARLDNPTLDFRVGDIRTYRAEKPVDVVVMLFHVLSYQTTDEDVRATLGMVAQNLKLGGLFCFDVWYAPAVRFQQPQERTKSVMEDGMTVIRHAIPEHDAHRHLVDVRYDIEVTTQETTSSFTEHHLMRYLDDAEIEAFLAETGFALRESSELLTASPLSHETWGAFYLAQKIEGVAS